MIKLSSKTDILPNISSDLIWSELDKITCAQTVPPEISYSTQYFGNFDNVFGGRKKESNFSIYLYRPISKSMRTEILAKGAVKH